MREIKFRAWNPKLKTLTHFDLHHREFIWKGEVSQFTGVHDKNGKEIYEGDIIRFADTYGQGGPHFAAVVFEHGAFIDSRFDGHISERREREIIGNIYENPELCAKES